jgi:hypothetical protein
MMYCLGNWLEHTLGYKIKSRKKSYPINIECNDKGEEV